MCSAVRSGSQSAELVCVVPPAVMRSGRRSHGIGFTVWFPICGIRVMNVNEMTSMCPFIGVVESLRENVSSLLAGVFMDQMHVRVPENFMKP